MPKPPSEVRFQRIKKIMDPVWEKLREKEPLIPYSPPWYEKRNVEFDNQTKPVENDQLPSIT